MDILRTPALVSVILPVYNRVRILGKSVESVLAQSYRRLELVIVDDASTDGSLELANRYSSDSRVTVIAHRERLGVSAARNTGIRAAEGGLLAFNDSDDIWASHKLEAQMKVVEAEPRTAVVGCGWRFASTGGGPTEGRLPGSGGMLYTSVLLGQAPGTGTPMLLLNRENLAHRVPQFDPSFPALVERDFLLREVGRGGWYEFANEALVVVDRSGTDHVAAPSRVATAYQLLLERYSIDIDEIPGGRERLEFLQARELVRAGRKSAAQTLVRGHSPMNRLTIALGSILGEKGLALAARVSRTARSQGYVRIDR